MSQKSHYNFLKNKNKVKIYVFENKNNLTNLFVTWAFPSIFKNIEMFGKNHSKNVFIENIFLLSKELLPINLNIDLEERRVYAFISL